MPDVRRTHRTGNPYEARFGYSRAVRRGPFVFVSGTTSVDPAGGAVQHPGDAGAQVGAGHREGQRRPGEQAHAEHQQHAVEQHAAGRLAGHQLDHAQQQDGDADGRAALRLAAHAAVGRRVPLQLRAAEGRRGVKRSIADSLRKAGVQVTAEAESLPALLVAPAGAGTVPGADDLTPILLVHAGTADTDRDMDETLAGIAARPGAV